jgi:hypothetical protein
MYKKDVSVCCTLLWSSPPPCFFLGFLWLWLLPLLPFPFSLELLMFSFLRFPSRRFFSVLLSPLVFACRASRALGSDVAGGWSCASSVSHFPNDGLHVSFPFGPVTVVGLSFRQRLMLWSDLLDCLLVQTSSWHWYRVAWSWAAREGVVCFFRGWRS